jgi:phosphatidylglycerophosphate synthase
LDAFGYLSVLLSIIIGLGVTQLLTGFGRVIRHRDRVRMDWLPLLWAIVLLVIFVQVWWSMFGLRLQREWSFGGFLLILAQTCALYLMAAVLLPEQVEAESIDLAAHYDRQHRWFFSFLVVALIISLAKDRVISGHWPTGLNLGFHILVLTLSLSSIAVRSRRYQEIMGILGAALIAVYIALLFPRLQ